MGTEVLRPHDCLVDRIRLAPAVFDYRRKNEKQRTNYNYSYRKPMVRPERSPELKKRSEPTISKRSSSSEDFNHNSNVLMGKVTILRRGQSYDALDPKIKSEKTTTLKKHGDDSVGMLGPDPVMVPKQTRVSPMAGNGRSVDMYAGSAFSMSPSPRSLPLPSFFSKKQGSKTVDDSATRDLRRLLRLE
ncbi:unnamed protein product [Ilex paraguariensis]|uniref:Uncharacterized protein n=1 Tax=Ilex paraguariensis TaxID=185542 RepID=A0ABC8SXJ3_9AQUA